jgi:hypothetical protein
MKRNTLIIAVGVILIGAIAYAGWKTIRTNREEKEKADSQN